VGGLGRNRERAAIAFAMAPMRAVGRRPVTRVGVAGQALRRVAGGNVAVPSEKVTMSP
jgi:hypothetical protein